MSDLFQDYSLYYDLLNSGKDYPGEVDYLLALARRHGAGPSLAILNLGCGTGRHDLLLAERGHRVTGVDRAATMLAQAEAAARCRPELPLAFVEGDITKFACAQRFALVLSLFHVVCYQTATADLLATFATAARHLDAGGLFIFDFWYGPAVLHDQPTVRIKRVSGEGVAIRRLTEPRLDPNANTVEVNFEVEIGRPATGERETLHETHLMRYLFLPEVIDLLQHAGLHFLGAEEWLSGRPPSLDTWYVCCVAQKK